MVRGWNGGVEPWSGGWMSGMFGRAIGLAAWGLWRGGPRERNYVCGFLHPSSDGLNSHCGPRISFGSPSELVSYLRPVGYGEFGGCISWLSTEKSCAFSRTATGRSCTTCAAPVRSGWRGTADNLPG